MAKIALGKRPKNFKSIVRFSLLDGGEGAIEMVYTYRTRTEFGSLIDGLLDDAGVNKPADDSNASDSMREALERTRATNADYILKVAEGWNLDEAFDFDTISQLCDELPAAALAIMDGYRAAITEGRLGN